MAGGEPRLGITWMNMHTQSATNHRHSQEQERDLHAYNPGAGRPEFVQSQSLAPIASKKFGLDHGGRMPCSGRQKTKIYVGRSESSAGLERSGPGACGSPTTVEDVALVVCWVSV